MAYDEGVVEVFNQSVVISEINVAQIMHPEYGELYLVREASGTDGNIPVADKLKLLEMGKLSVIRDFVWKKSGDEE